MPILVHSKCFKTFKAAQRGVMRWKRFGAKRAGAYLGSFFRKQEKSAKIIAMCRGKRNGAKPRSISYSKVKSSRRHSPVIAKGRGRGGRDALASVFRGRRRFPKRFSNVTIYKTRPKGYRYKIKCGKTLITYVKRKPFAEDIRDMLKAKGKRGCRVLKA